MKTNYILVCNASRASIYATNETRLKKNLQLIIELEHKESRKKRLDLVTDRSGHYQTEHKSRGAYKDHVDPKEYEAEQFAKQLTDQLEKYYYKQAFDKLVIITPPHFFGLLEKHFSQHIIQTISQVIQKDYTLSTAPDLRKILYQISKLT